MFCSHHYQYTQGYFFCTKCGKRRYPTHKRRGKNKKIITISIILVLFVTTLYFFSDKIINLSSVQQKAEEISSNVQVPTQKEISKTIQEAKNTIEQTSKTIPVISKPKFDIAKIENLVYTYTNEQRTKNGLSELRLDPRLADIARSHSDDMADRNYFAHDTPEGLDPTARGLKGGYNCHKELGDGYYTEGIAENIAQNWLYTSYMTKGVYTSYNWHSEESLAREIVDGWMNSAGHRQNILTSGYDRIGIGIGISEDDAVYATQNFC